MAAVVEAGIKPGGVSPCWPLVTVVHAAGGQMSAQYNAVRSRFLIMLTILGARGDWLASTQFCEFYIGLQLFCDTRFFGREGLGEMIGCR